MCIFAQPVVSVTDTNIFARILPGGWQALVYQMGFESQQQNAIILPLPVEQPARDEGSLEFVSLKGYGSFFKDLNKGYPLRAYPSKSISRGFGRVDSVKLKVHDVGEFVASFVPTLADFDRLDEQFRVPGESWDKIPKYKDYGFAVFQLKSLKGKPHPMAFKFRSRLINQDPGSVFFPTVHIHDGEVHATESFDHTLFLQAPEFDKVCGDYQQKDKLVTDRATGYVRSKWPAKQFCNIEKSKDLIAGDQLVHRLQMKGMLENKDILANLNPSVAGIGSLFPVLPALTCIGGLAGMKWFFDRRNTVANTKANQNDAGSE